MRRAEHVFDALVIGSGFGGAVCAFRLAEQGRCVLVLERGRPYPPGSFARTPDEFRKAFWDPAAGLHGLFDLWRFRGLDIVCASGLGGGSLIYANVLLKKDAESFVREDLAAGGREHWPLRRDELEPHYENVCKMLAPQRYPYKETRKTRAIEHAAGALGFPVERPELAVLFAADASSEPVPGAPIVSDDLHRRPRCTCRLCGECDVGCNFGAKNTLDFTYLSAAARAGAELRTCCEARTIEPLRDGGYRVGYRQHLSARDGHRDELLDPVEEAERSVLARRVIVAAGAVGSPRLLLRNRAALPGLSPALGTRVSGNGDALVVLRGARRQLDPSHGPVITASMRVPEGRSPSGRGYEIQDGGAPVLADWFWEARELPKLPWRARRFALRELRGMLFGGRDTNLSGELAGLITDRSARVMPLLGHGRDVPDGRYVLEGDRLELDWSVRPSEDYYRGLEQGFEAIARALGARSVPSIWKRLNRSVTIHPLGGCPMADDPRHGVVDAYGRVHGWPGLYVADGSVMPGPVGVNPSFTIAAFADRAAERILA